MSSRSSVAPPAPSADSAGSPSAHAYAQLAEQPLPPPDQKVQSWLTSMGREGLMHMLRQSPFFPAASGNLNRQSPMSEDIQARLAKAKKLQEPRWTDYFNRFAQSDRNQAAIEIYTQVAREFFNAKSDKRLEAGDAFKKAALLQLNEFNKNDGSMTDCLKGFEEAHLAYYDVRPLESAECLQQMVKLWLSNGNYNAAAPWSEKLGSLYLIKCDDLEKAIEAWQDAGNWYKNARNMALAIRNYNKVAEAYAKKGDYYKAIETWEWCANNYPDNSYGIKSSQITPYFYKAGLCHVAVADTVALSRAIQHYVDLDNPFGRTRECRFLFDLSKAMEDGDEEQFKVVKDLYKRTGNIPPEQEILIDEGLKRLRDAEDNFA